MHTQLPVHLLHTQLLIHSPHTVAHTLSARAVYCTLRADTVAHTLPARTVACRQLTILPVHVFIAVDRTLRAEEGRYGVKVILRNQAGMKVTVFSP